MSGLPPLESLMTGAPVSAGVRYGRVSGMAGISLEAVGLDAALGDICRIRSSCGEVPAEVVGFDEERLVLMPIGDARGVGPGDPVLATGRPLEVRVGPGALGRVLDALGRPLDGGPPVRGKEVPILRDAPPPMSRVPIERPIETGISAIDGFLTMGLGQRTGIFAGSGVGKSTLLGMIAKASSADVNVIALVGERGREVRDFVEEVLGEEGMAKSVLVVSTSDTAPLLRYKAVFTAIAVAEAFRDEGLDVLFMMDSVTRFAAAAREIGLAVGEPPTLRGYPPSFFAVLPKVVERLGTSDCGSITGLFTILVEGDDLNEPVSDTMRGLLDGHFVLDRRIASLGRFPAIDVLASVSRLMPKVTSREHVEAARVIRAMLARHEENKDLIQVGAWQRGADPDLDRAVDAMPEILELLHQGTSRRGAEETMARMAKLVRGSAAGNGGLG